MKSWAALLLFCGLTAHADFETEAQLDGDVVTCAGAMPGLFALDYLRFVKENARPPVLAPIDQFALTAVLQHLGFFGFAKDSFYFLSSERRPSDSFSGPNVWQEAAFGFAPVDPERAKKSVPAACASPVTAHLIRRFREPNADIFQYNPALRSALRASEIQYNLMLLREWLSQYTDDSALVSDINLRLHEPGLTSSEPKMAQIGELLKKMLLVPPPAPQNSCERSQLALEPLQRALRKHCESISPADLPDVHEMRILDDDHRIIYFEQFKFRSFDFAGLSGLESLDVENVLWFGDSLTEGLFRDAKNLHTLKIHHSELHQLTPYIFFGIHNLHELDLTDSSLETIFPGAFEGVFTRDPNVETRLRLGGEQTFGHLEGASFSGLETLKSLSFAGAYFRFSFAPGFLESFPNLETLDLTEAKGLKFEATENAPELRTLILRGVAKLVEQFGNLPKLENLDLAHSFNSDTPNLQLLRFPQLRVLDLSDTQFYAFLKPTGRERLALRELHQLENLNLMDTTFVGEDGSDPIFQILDTELPLSLRTLDLCERGFDANRWRSATDQLHQKNPQLKIRTKNFCEGDWIDLTT